MDQRFDQEQAIFIDSLYKSYLDKDINGDKTYTHKFIYNDENNNENVLKNIVNCLNELKDGDEFFFSVAFITDSGLSTLKEALYEVSLKKVKGKILTTNYLNFTDPKSLEFLFKFDNIETKIIDCDDDLKSGFHTKGYIFKYNNQGIIKALIGSSNITRNALMTNFEWNLLTISSLKGEVVNKVLEEFQRLFDKALSLNQQFIDAYRKKYNLEKAKRDNVSSDETTIIEPNQMQIEVYKRLNELIINGEKRGLLIAATGTGKTYASAFVIKYLEFEANKIIYITHREEILLQAMKSYQKVLGDKYSMSLFSGNTKNSFNRDADIVFATHALMIKKENLELWDKDHFDIVIIDEVHKVGENRYQDIINYFNPKFLFGMTATPDRMDGYDLYDLFDHNIIHEIRLDEALNNDMLVPFDYFGITDIFADGLENEGSFNEIVSDERAQHIIKMSDYYGYSGDYLKGLIFVPKRKFGVELAIKLNALNKKAKFIDGETSQSERIETIKRLKREDLKDPDDYLDYIITVNIFNEGIDIPEVNQVIFLRPTESSIIFIQQLGRGLRKYNNKDRLVILDFIGNYKTNYLIPSSFVYKMDSVDFLVERTQNITLYHNSTIQFDEIARQKILKSICLSNISSLNVLKEEYIILKQKLGRIPRLIEIDKSSKISSDSIKAAKNNYDTYYLFLRKVEKDYKVNLSLDEEIFDKYLFRGLVNGRKVEDLLLLKCILMQGDYDDYLSLLKNYNIYNISKNLLGYLNAFFKGTYSNGINVNKIATIKNNQIIIDDDFLKLLDHQDFVDILWQTVESGLYKYETKYHGNTYDDTFRFVLHERYTRFDVSRIINKNVDIEMTVNGYQNYDDCDVIPIFVDYHKDKDEFDPTNYEDKFIDENTFIWISRFNCYSSKGQIKDIIDAYNNGRKILLFVRRKVDSKDNEFYFLGDVTILSYEDFKKQIKDKNGMLKVYNFVRFIFKINETVRKDIYEYLTFKD